MALNEIHPESSSLQSTFVPAEQEGLRNHQQRPHSSHHPLEERSTALTEVELQSTSQNLQVLLHAAAGSSTGSCNSNSSHQNTEVNGIRGTSEHIERHHVAYEPPAPQYSRAMKKWKRRVLVTLAKITALLVLAIVIAGIFAVPVTLVILKANVSNLRQRHTH